MRDRNAAERLAAMFHTPYYHVGTTTDLSSSMAVLLTCRWIRFFTSEDYSQPYEN